MKHNCLAGALTSIVASCSLGAAAVAQVRPADDQAASAAAASVSMPVGRGVLPVSSASASVGHYLAPDSSFTPRLLTPRISPLDKSDATPEQLAILASVPNANVFRTLARSPALFTRWGPFGQYILGGTSIQPRHREMAMLRMGWLCQSPYEWAAHARIAQDRAGMTAAEVHAIAQGSDASGWSEIDRAVLNMTDELRYGGAVSNATWAELRKVYSDRQVIELIATAGQYQVISMALNALGVQVDPGNQETLPADLALPAVAGRVAVMRSSPRPLLARTAANRRSGRDGEAVPGPAPDTSEGEAQAAQAAQQRLTRLRASFSAYIENGGLLPPRVRELLILRTAWNQRDEPSWQRHSILAQTSGLSKAEIGWIEHGPSASGWSIIDKAVLQAADDLRREAFISDLAYSELANRFDERQLIEIIFTVGCFDMTAMENRSSGPRGESSAPQTPSQQDLPPQRPVIDGRLRR